jgi:uncharacterized Tic20 family protein
MTELSDYKPAEDEAEKASGSYLMSMMAMAVGIALPIVNLIATLIFFIGNRRSTYFVRWHCTQALISQLSMLPVNSVVVGWSLSILLTDRMVTNAFVAYVMVAAVLNSMELVMTVRSAIRTRRGEHVSWYFYGPLTDKLCPPPHA